MNAETYVILCNRTDLYLILIVSKPNKLDWCKLPTHVENTISAQTQMPLILWKSSLYILWDIQLQRREKKPGPNCMRDYMKTRHSNCKCPKQYDDNNIIIYVKQEKWFKPHGESQYKKWWRIFLEWWRIFLSCLLFNISIWITDLRQIHILTLCSCSAIYF